jgi:hypothetical protein
VDNNFPRNENSLLGLDENGKEIPPHFKHGADAEIDYKHVSFFNPNQIFEKKDYYLFEGKIEADDVKQGASIGNCYLMSIIATMSHRKDLIYNIFRTDFVNKDGLYQIYYYDEVDQKKKIMFVDHYFPYYCNYKKKIDEDMGSLGANPNGNELWVLILEKCYAKFEGGYANINYGTTLSELYWLTGGLTRKMNTNNEFAWKNIKISCGKRCLMSCNSKKGSGSHDNKTKSNIANSHSYSILDADEYQGIKLIKLRNPWGEGEFTGDFSDTSKLWTPELKEYFGYDYAKEKKGLFFMKFEDFQKEFDHVIFCFA